jgi:hypothetical protein
MRQTTRPRLCRVSYFFGIRHSLQHRIAPFAFLVLSAAFLCALWPAAAPAAAPWWNHHWQHRLAVVAPPRARHSMLVELDAAAARQDGADIRVLNAAQTAPVAWRSVHRSGGKLTLEIALPDAASVAPNELPPRFFIYYGNPNAEPLDYGRWDLPSVCAEILLLAQGQQPETWDDVQFLLERNRRETERQFVPHIAPEVILFDRSRPQLTVYRATLRCAEDGDYLFSLNSTGASFLVINDRLVAANPGVPRWGRPKASDAVTLAAGLHRIELYHVCLGPASAVSLSWETPQMRRARLPRPQPDFRTVPAESLLPAARGQQLSQEKADAAVNPFFTYTQRGAVRVNDVPEPFYTVQFFDATVAAARIVWRQWDFGDGRAVVADNPVRVFAGDNPRQVTLTVADANGRTFSISREVQFEKVAPVTAQVLMEVERLPAVVAPDAPLNFSLTVRNLRHRQMELKLTSMPLPCGGPTQQQPEEFLLKLGADDSFTTEIQCPPPRNRPLTDTMLSALSLGLKFNEVDVARLLIRFVRPDDPLKSIQRDGHLVNDTGELLVLVADLTDRRAVSPPSVPQRVVCLDDTLCGNGVVMDGGASFARSLEAMLKIPVIHLPLNTEARAAEGVPTLHKLTQLDGAPIQKGDWVIVSLGLPDLHDRVSAPDFQKQIVFIADYLRLTKGANVLLVAPPPVPADPEAPRAYAKKVVQIGLEKNLPVLDLYSLMRVRSGWKDFYRDKVGTTDSIEAGSYLYYPNSTGQKWIAEELARMISKWKP